MQHMQRGTLQYIKLIGGLRQIRQLSVTSWPEFVNKIACQESLGKEKL
jgi:hypothetical protein